MPVLLRFSQRSHADVVLLQPARDGIGVTPFIFAFAINLGNLYSAQLLFDILLVKPVPILIESLSSESLSHNNPPVFKVRQQRRVFYFCRLSVSAKPILHTLIVVGLPLSGKIAGYDLRRFPPRKLNNWRNRVAQKVRVVT
jgi:hypothetical protein